MRFKKDRKTKQQRKCKLWSGVDKRDICYYNAHQTLLVLLQRNKNLAFICKFSSNLKIQHSSFLWISLEKGPARSEMHWNIFLNIFLTNLLFFAATFSSFPGFPSSSKTWWLLSFCFPFRHSLLCWWVSKWICRGVAAFCCSKNGEETCDTLKRSTFIMIDFCRLESTKCIKGNPKLTNSEGGTEG